MSVAAKLAGFAAVLALVFAGAAFAGSRIDVHPGGRPARGRTSPAWARWRAGARWRRSPSAASPSATTA